MTRFIALLTIIGLIAGSAYARELGDLSEPDLTISSDLEPAAQVKDYYADWLSSFPGVSGVGVGKDEKGQPAITVNVTEVTPQIKQIPTRLNGIPVIVSQPNGVGVIPRANDVQPDEAGALPNVGRPVQPDDDSGPKRIPAPLFNP
jgi:hypothetical protein